MAGNRHDQRVNARDAKLLRMEREMYTTLYAICKDKAKTIHNRTLNDIKSLAERIKNAVGAVGRVDTRRDDDIIKNDIANNKGLVLNVSYNSTMLNPDLWIHINHLTDEEIINGETSTFFANWNDELQKREAQLAAKAKRAVGNNSKSGSPRSGLCTNGACSIMGGRRTRKSKKSKRTRKAKKSTRGTRRA